MNDSTSSRDHSRRRLVAAAGIGVALGAALGALGLSVYNTARFDDRVHDYLTTHRAELRGATGATGAPGPAGPEGPPGPAGTVSTAELRTELSYYDLCLSQDRARWASGFTISTLGGSATVRPPSYQAIYCAPSVP